MIALRALRMGEEPAGALELAISPATRSDLRFRIDRGRDPGDQDVP